MGEEARPRPLAGGEGGEQDGGRERKRDALSLDLAVVLWRGRGVMMMILCGGSRLLRRGRYSSMVILSFRTNDRHESARQPVRAGTLKRVRTPTRE
jgi:hypothetical protein